jgi:hypothetical protein
MYLECELLVLGNEYTADFYSLSDNEINARRSHEGIDLQRLDCRSIFSTTTISFIASKAPTVLSTYRMNTVNTVYIEYTVNIQYTTIQ